MMTYYTIVPYIREGIISTKFYGYPSLSSPYPIGVFDTREKALAYMPMVYLKIGQLTDDPYRQFHDHEGFNIVSFNLDEKILNENGKRFIKVEMDKFDETFSISLEYGDYDNNPNFFAVEYNPVSKSIQDLQDEYIYENCVDTFRYHAILDSLKMYTFTKKYFKDNYP